MNKIYTKYLSLILLILAVCVIISGCSLLKARPAEDSGFLPFNGKLAEMRERSPFNGGWIPDSNKIEELKKTHKNITVLPVVTDLLEEKVKKSGNSQGWKDERIEDARELAKYFENRMLLSFATNNIYSVSSEVKPDSFVWEIAITELDPTSPTVSVAATAAGFLVPGGGVIRAVGTGSIAIEGIVRDSNTGDILATFKDREADKSSPFSVKDFQLYAHARVAIDDWAEQFFKLASTPQDVTVEDSLPISLNPL